ncbi:MAG TPA: hypothetical protein PKY77_18825 [Phycisphaerae bacterium]|nr:hypothetical protein [Phycisphaerae bacterium]HRY66367.1 hypothetical protein [Phycisphaerae bacterium]HSA25927.1 hypothetical protein [Phycisphaerae bacterium]
MSNESIVDANTELTASFFSLLYEEPSDLDRLIQADLSRQLFGDPDAVHLLANVDEDEDEVGDVTADVEIETYRKHFFQVFHDEFDRLVA